jgi:HK97 family phage portal protein
MSPFPNPFRRKAKARKTERRILDVSSVNYPLRYGPSVVNEAVEFEALRLGPVFAAGRVLASSISCLPLEQYATRGGATVKVPLSPLFVSPSATGTLHDWIWRAVTSMAYTGNVVGVVTERNNLDYPTRVEWLKTDLVFVQDSLPTLGERGSFTDPIFTYMGAELPRQDIVHIPWFTMTGRVWGLSPLGAYAQMAQIGLDAIQYKQDWFRSGGIPPGQFQNKEQTVSQADAQAIKSRLVQSIRSHEPIVYGNDWEYTPFTIPQPDAQFVETMGFAAAEIAAIYGIPPEMIGGSSATGKSVTYHNSEQQTINFVQFTLIPWLTKLEAVFSTMLPRGQFVKFNVDEMIRADSVSRWGNYESARRIGAMSVNEIRALEGMSPIADGDDYTPLPQGGVPALPPADPQDVQDGGL